MSKEKHAIEAWLKKGFADAQKREGKARIEKEREQSRKRSRTKEKKGKRRKAPFTGSKLQMRDRQVNHKRTCTPPVSIRTMPEIVIPPAKRVIIISGVSVSPDSSRKEKSNLS